MLVQDKVLLKAVESRGKSCHDKIALVDLFLQKFFQNKCFDVAQHTVIMNICP